MRLLALDTATEACSAALWVDGDVAERYAVAPRQHATLILPMVQSLLAEAQLELTGLDAIAFGCGPGSFTGVRIATGVVQGLALGAELPVAPISDLAALAQRGRIEPDCDEVWVAFDARMDEVYWGIYGFDEHGMACAIRADCVVSPDQVRVRDDGVDPRSVATGRTVYAMGGGWSAYGARLNAALGVEPRIHADHLPRAWQIAELAVRRVRDGELLPPERALPTYLRNEVARRPTVAAARIAESRLIDYGKETQRQ